MAHSIGKNVTVFIMGRCLGLLAVKPSNKISQSDRQALRRRKRSMEGAANKTTQASQKCLSKEVLRQILLSSLDKIIRLRIQFVCMYSMNAYTIGVAYAFLTLVAYLTKTTTI